MEGQPCVSQCFQEELVRSVFPSIVSGLVAAWMQQAQSTDPKVAGSPNLEEGKSASEHL